MYNDSMLGALLAGARAAGVRDARDGTYRRFAEAERYNHLPETLRHNLAQEYEHGYRGEHIYRLLSDAAATTNSPKYHKELIEARENIKARAR